MLVNFSTVVPVLSAIFQQVSPSEIRYNCSPSSHLRTNVGPKKCHTVNRNSATRRKKGAMYRQSSALRAANDACAAGWPVVVSE